jgi:alkylmercury lyase
VRESVAVAARLRLAVRRSDRAVSLRWLGAPLLRLLAHGVPVTAQSLAHATSRDAAVVRAVVPTLPGVELDGEGAVIGWGVTLTPTPHRLLSEGTELHVWCPLEALYLPTVLGWPVSLSSRCPATGQPVLLEVTPTTASTTTPVAVAVPVAPLSVDDIRTSLCEHVHLLAAGDSADQWVERHPGTALLELEDALTVSVDLADALFNPGSDAHGCC